MRESPSSEVSLHGGLVKAADPHLDPHEETSGRKQWKHGCERVFQSQRKRSKTSGKRYFQNFSTLCNQQVGGSNPPSPTKLRIERCGVLLFSRRFPNYFMSFCGNGTGSRTTIFGRKPVLFLLFPLLLTACRGQSYPACCLSLRDIDANPDANGDGTKRAWLDKMR